MNIKDFDERLAVLRDRTIQSRNTLHFITAEVTTLRRAIRGLPPKDRYENEDHIMAPYVPKPKPEVKPEPPPQIPPPSGTYVARADMSDASPTFYHRPILRTNLTKHFRAVVEQYLTDYSEIPHAEIAAALHCAEDLVTRVAKQRVKSNQQG